MTVFLRGLGVVFLVSFALMLYLCEVCGDAMLKAIGGVAPSGFKGATNSFRKLVNFLTFKVRHFLGQGTKKCHLGSYKFFRKIFIKRGGKK